MVSPSPQLMNMTDGSIVALWKYAHDFRHQHMTDADNLIHDLDDEDHNLAIRRLVVT
jgi:hypothetical protein